MPIASLQSSPPFMLSVPGLPEDDVPMGLVDDPSYRVMDDPQEWPAFSHPVAQQADCWESTMVFEGMHCTACAFTLEAALQQVPGVLSVNVNAASHRGRVVWSAQATKPSAWMQAAAQAGYRAVPAFDTLALERRRAQTRLALWRLGVAGLCMMQVMMYAWPAYVAAPGDISPDMAQLLRWASWVLSMPVLLFSCAPFFSNALRDLRQRRISMDLPVALGMAITFGVSTIGTFEADGVFGAEVYFDSFTMFVFFLLAGRWLELSLRDRTAGALEALMNRLPDSVQRRNGCGDFERVAVRRLGVGDVIRVLPGESFPADGVVLEGQTLVDEALLTGESRPLLRGAGGECSAVIAGSHNLSAAVLVRVEHTGNQTRFAQIVALMESASLSKPRLAMVADRIAKPFLLMVLAAAGGAAAHGWSQDPGHALMVAVAVLVVTCPCALSLAAPAAMLASAGALARRGVLVRRLQAIETLARVDILVFDKTGTLTRDAFAVRGVQTREGMTEQDALTMACALAQHSLHPVSQALVQAGQARGPSARGVLPRPSWRAGSVQEVAGQGIVGQLNLAEAPGQSVTVRLGSARFCQVPQPDGNSLHACLSDERGWVATFELSEDVRTDAKAAVAALAGLGVKAMVLSGDVPDAVARVAGLTGIADARGACTPQDKLQVMQSLQAKGHTVAMVGDGLNDGPVLAGAHVSFAFGKAVPLAQAQSDFVVLGEQLSTVVQAVVHARRTVRIVLQNLGWAAVYNAVCVPLAVGGWLPAWLAGLGMAFSSLGVVLNALRLASVAQTVPPGAMEFA